MAAALVSKFRESVVDWLRNSPDGAAPAQELVSALVDELNLLVQETEIYDRKAFEGVKVGADVGALLKRPNLEGEDLVTLNRLLLRDGLAPLIADVPKIEPQWFPDFRGHYRTRFVELIKKKSYAAKPVHRNVVIGDQNLAGLFDDPEALVDALAASPLINTQHPRSSRFFEVTSFSGPMYFFVTVNSWGSMTPVL